jgi:hypothetical protein
MANQTVSREPVNWLSLFQPDVLAPMQYMEKWRYRRASSPEVLLMFAVLDDAVVCFQKFACAPNAHGKALFHDAESWFFEDGDGGLFSFENICEVVGLDAAYIRKGLQHWRESAKTKRPKFRLFYIVGPGRSPRSLTKSTKVKSAQQLSPG